MLCEVYYRRCLVRLCIYIFYTVCGDQIQYNFLFGKQAGWIVWNGCEKGFLSGDKLTYGWVRVREWSGGGR